MLAQFNDDCFSGSRLAQSRFLPKRETNEQRSREETDLSRLHGLEFNLHIVDGKILLTSWITSYVK